MEKPGGHRRARRRSLSVCVAAVCIFATAYSAFVHADNVGQLLPGRTIDHEPNSAAGLSSVRSGTAAIQTSNGGHADAQTYVAGIKLPAHLTVPVGAGYFCHTPTTAL